VETAVNLERGVGGDRSFYEKKRIKRVTDQQFFHKIKGILYLIGLQESVLLSKKIMNEFQYTTFSGN
jgi:hypothetical protein